MADIVYPPPMVSPTTLVDPNPHAVWTPSLTNGVDYILVSVGKRSKRMIVQGGRNIIMVGFEVYSDLVTTNSEAPIFKFEGGSTNRIIYAEGCLFSNLYQQQTDGIRSTGNAGSTGTILKLKKCRVEGLIGSDALVAPAVHADGVQLPGGVGELWMEDVTVQSGYVTLQFQREQSVLSNPARTITALSRSGTIYDCTVTTGLDIAVGDWVEIENPSPATWSGTFRVTELVTGSAPNVTRHKGFLGDGGQAAWSSGGTATKSEWQYPVGRIRLNRVNLLSMPNNGFTDPTQTLTGIRFGGRPDAKGSNAEDRSPLIVEGMGGNFECHDFWINPNPGETLVHMIEPGDGSNVYSLARGVRNAGSPA